MKKPNCVYLFGVDPIWNLSKNSLPFINSLKMKISIIIGVLQMLFAIILKGLNSIHNRNKIDFFFEFIPQLIFMFSIFG